MAEHGLNLAQTAKRNIRTSFVLRVISYMVNLGRAAKKIAGICAQDMGKLSSPQKRKNASDSPRSIASKSSSGRSRALTVKTVKGGAADASIRLGRCSRPPLSMGDPPHRSCPLGIPV